MFCSTPSVAVFAFVAPSKSPLLLLCKRLVRFMLYKVHLPVGDCRKGEFPRCVRFAMLLVGLRDFSIRTSISNLMVVSLVS